MEEHSARTTYGQRFVSLSPSLWRAEDARLASPHGLKLAIHPRRVLYVLLGIIAALAFASTVAGALLYLFAWPEDSFAYEMVKLFWVDTEHNIPTLYQCMVMFAASALFFLLGEQYRRKPGAPSAGWYVLGAAFTFLAWDEGAQIHEKVGFHFGTTFDGTWLYFYVPAAAALLASLVPFLSRLPQRTRSLLLSSGMLYAAGAVGAELVGQLHAEAAGRTNAVYAALATIEEVLEMLGVAFLIFALLEHLGAVTRAPERTGRLTRS